MVVQNLAGSKADCKFFIIGQVAFHVVVGGPGRLHDGIRDVGVVDDLASAGLIQAKSGS